MMLIAAQELVSHPGAVVLDCRFDLMNPSAGHEAWVAGHIPGAFYADLDKDLAAPRGSHTGRHPLPDRAAFAALLGSWGITPSTMVVAYDDVGGAIAARLWWLLGWVGHTHRAILDGGLQAWQAAGLPVSTDRPETGAASVYPASASTHRTIDADAVAIALDAEQLCLIDARDPVRFAGGSEPIDAVAGHIPGAVNRCFKENLTADGRFKSPETLRDEFTQLLAGLPPVVASMCGSGVTACHNLFAMELAGLPPAALFVGSWSGWISDPARPVARQEDKR